MMVDLGEAKIFEGQMAQTLHCIVGREFAPSHLPEEFADGFGVHGRTQESAPGIQRSGNAV
jgi:hypothetical protein